MENKKGMNLVLAGAICLALAGVLIFISLNKEENVMDNEANSEVTGEENLETIDNAGPSAQAGDSVTMNYTGRLEDGTVFDSNVDPKFGHVEPFIFPLGAGRVIAGWDKGIVGMKVGEKKTLTIPSEDAYGASGIPGLIPPNATLIFEVELLAIN